MYLCAFRCLISRTPNLILRSQNSKPNSEVTKSKVWKITAFSKNYVTSEGAASHNVLYYQTLPITCHQEGFYANNYFG